MRPRPSRLCSVAVATSLALALPVVSATAQALGDRVHADSFGNLVIHSRSGYKRIVVGKGHLAIDAAGVQEPGGRGEFYRRYGLNEASYWCWRPAVLLKGRDYMYGLADGELPDLPGNRCGFSEIAAPGAAITRVQP
jgi:hypothetical protein